MAQGLLTRRELKKKLETLNVFYNMKRNKYVTIDIDGETNVGVINLGDLTDVHSDDVNTALRQRTEDALVEAVKSHFDYPVKVRVPSIVKSLHPIRIDYVVVVEDEEEDKEVHITLNETWMY